MRRLILIVLALAFAAPGVSAAAGAAILGDTAVAFSADRRLVIDDRSYSGRVFAEPGRQRHEQILAGVRQVIILRADRAQGWLVLPDLRTYVAFTFPRAAAELSDPRLRRDAVGHESINGVATTKYRIDHQAKDGTSASGFLWISATGIVMRADGSVTLAQGGRPVRIHMELSNLRVAPQDPGLFEVPQGLARLPAGALEPLLGVGH